MRTIEEKLKLPNPKVDLGCGLNRHEKEKDEYIYVDGDAAPGIDIVCDWSKIPLPSGAIMEIHTSDTVEHIPPWEQDSVYREWNRIMKVGGKLWGTTPNLDHVCRAFAKGTQNLEWALRNLYGDRSGPHHVHYVLHTATTLTELLTRYGFGRIKFAEVGGQHCTSWWWLAFECYKINNVPF
jgi:predicted SAM-dependent methyltransferase